MVLVTAELMESWWEKRRVAPKAETRAQYLVKSMADSMADKMVKKMVHCWVELMAALRVE